MFRRTLLLDIMRIDNCRLWPIASFRGGAAIGGFWGHSDTDTCDSTYRRRQHGRLMCDARRSN
jgi:hypothetical protein